MEFDIHIIRPILYSLFIYMLGQKKVMETQWKTRMYLLKVSMGYCTSSFAYKVIQLDVLDSEVLDYNVLMRLLYEKHKSTFLVVHKFDFKNF